MFDTLNGAFLLSLYWIDPEVLACLWIKQHKALLWQKTEETSNDMLVILLHESKTNLVHQFFLKNNIFSILRVHWSMIRIVFIVFFVCLQHWNIWTNAYRSHASRSSSLLLLFHLEVFPFIHNLFESLLSLLAKLVGLVEILVLQLVADTHILKHLVMHSG